MATVQTILNQQREQVASLERELEKQRERLIGMELIAAAEPSVARVKQGREAASSSTGRQEGAISVRWRKVLGTLGLVYDQGFSANQTIECVRAFENREMKPSQVRRIFDNYLAQGILEQPADDLYRITEAAWERLGLKELAEPAQNSPDENEAPEGEPADASETGGWGVQPLQPFVAKPNPWLAARESE